MANPILKQMQNRTPVAQPNNPMQLIQQFNQFKQQMSGQNPKQVVEQMMQSGQMSQQEFEQLKQQAEGLMQLLR